MKTKLSLAMAASVTASLLAACGNDSTDVGNDGGTGGSAGVGGSAAGQGGSADNAGAPGNAGSGGSGGSGGAEPARFTAVREQERLKLVPLDTVWLQSCSEQIQPVQLVAGSWSVLRDERPDAFNENYGAHYADGMLHSDCSLSLGCDVGGCMQLPTDPERVWDEMFVDARELVQVGQQAAPLCDGDAPQAGLDAGVDAGVDAGSRLVPVLESRAASGPLGIRVRYYRDSSCSTELTANVPVE